MKLSLLSPLETAKLLKVLAECKIKKVVITKLRFCNTGDKSDFVESYINNENKKIIFLGKYQVKPGYIFVDQFENHYQIIDSKIENVSIKDDIQFVTTVCSFNIYFLSNPFRSHINQSANIDQTIRDFKFENIQVLNLTFNQRAEISQKITLQELIDSAYEENKYLFKPLSNLDSLISLVKEVTNCARELNELENKIIDSVLKEAKGLIRDMAELLISKIRK